MKVKVYPLDVMNDYIEATASPFCLQVQIICASLAKGTSTIKNIISSRDVETTISWCKSIGANIKKSNDRLIIKGVNNTITFKESLFISNHSAMTAKLMIPVLCVIPQPFGIQIADDMANEILQYKPILEELGVSVFANSGIIRFEKAIHPKECEVDGDIDIAFAAGLLMAYPLLNKHSTLKLRAPIRSEKNYSTIIKILKHFHVDIKHPATMRYDINGKQSYKKGNITTEMDKFMLSQLSLLSLKLPNNNVPLHILNYRRGSTQNDVKLFNFMKKYIINFKQIIPSNTIKRKDAIIYKENLKMELCVENSLPLLMVIGVLNHGNSEILKVDLTKQRINKQFLIMKAIFKKLNLFCEYSDNSIKLTYGNVEIKKQVDCENNPYVAMAISILATLSNQPIIIKNVECVYNIQNDFFENLKKYGATIDYIYD